MAIEIRRTMPVITAKMMKTTPKNFAAPAPSNPLPYLPTVLSRIAVSRNAPKEKPFDRARNSKLYKQAAGSLRSLFEAEKEPEQLKASAVPFAEPQQLKIVLEKDSLFGGSAAPKKTTSSIAKGVGPIVQQVGNSVPKTPASATAAPSVQSVWKQAKSCLKSIWDSYVTFQQQQYAAEGIVRQAEASVMLGAVNSIAEKIIDYEIRYLHTEEWKQTSFAGRLLSVFSGDFFHTPLSKIGIRIHKLEERKEKIAEKTREMSGNKLAYDTGMLTADIGAALVECAVLGYLLEEVAVKALPALASKLLTLTKNTTPSLVLAVGSTESSAVVIAIDAANINVLSAALATSGNLGDIIEHVQEFKEDLKEVHADNEKFSVSESRRRHILDGEGPSDPGHGPNRGFSEGAFPDSWTDDQVISAIEEVANDPQSTWKQSTGPGYQTAPITQGAPDANAPLTTNSGNPVRFVVRGRNHGLNIEVIIEPNGEGIITGYCIGK